MIPTRLVLLSHDPAAPSPAFVIDDDRIVERVLLAPDPLDPPAPMRTVLVVPGADALARWLELPVRNEAQAGPAAAYLLEDQLATPRERAHLTVGPPEPDGRRLVVVVDRLVLQAWTARALALGVFPNAIVPDHLIAPAPEDGSVLVIPFGETLAVRGERLALSCEPELLALVVGERPALRVEDPAEIERLLVAAALDPPIDLLLAAGPAAPERSAWRELRVAAALAALLALSPLALSLAQTLRYDAAADSVEARIEARARAALPRAGRVADPDAAIRARIARLRAADSFPSSAAALFTALEKTPGIELDALAYAPDAPMRATVSYLNPADLEVFRAAARQAGLEVESGGASNAGARIVSQLTLRHGA